LRKFSLAEILAHEWFALGLSQSWGRGLRDAEFPRLKRCARTCGEKFNVQRGLRIATNLGEA
jgi:hypothetical protein